MMDCKKALEESDGDIEKAAEFLRKKGIASAAKKAERATNEGLVGIVHPHGGKVGVLVEVNCETDFVARTDEFQELVHNIAMHIAAARPWPCARDEVRRTCSRRRRKSTRRRCASRASPRPMIDKIVTARSTSSTATSACSSRYVKDPDMTVKDSSSRSIGKLGENIEGQALRALPDRRVDGACGPGRAPGYRPCPRRPGRIPMASFRFSRILLKLSGEVLADGERLRHASSAALAQTIAKAAAGSRSASSSAAGNIFRARSANSGRQTA